MIGRTLSHFEITAKLGEGGMGEVYRATDTKLAREVAIKVLPHAFVADVERLARFEREARLLAALDHVNVAGIYEVGEHEGKHFLAMQLAEGEELSTRIGRGAIPLEEALPIALQIAAALEAAHAKGIVHRDLKPSNVMLDAQGQVKVRDDLGGPATPLRHRLRRPARAPAGAFPERASRRLRQGPSDLGARSPSSGDDPGTRNRRCRPTAGPWSHRSSDVRARTSGPSVSTARRLLASRLHPRW